MHPSPPPTLVRHPLLECVADILGPTTNLEATYRAATTIRDQPHLLRTFLTSLRHHHLTAPRHCCQSVLDGVAARSSIHPNGFAKIVLHTEDKWGIRLHVWRPRTRWHLAENKPHGHRWEFASWIITGVLRETTFDRVTDGEPFELLAYGRRADGSSYLVLNGTDMLAPRQPIDRPAGTVYVRSSSVLHTTESLGGGLVASLVFQGRRSRRTTPVYRQPGAPPLQREQPLSVDEVSDLLAELVEVVS